MAAGESPASVGEAEKEHVMVGVQVRVEGRPGLLLADPGYHVPRVVTVMQDTAYPHTGEYPPTLVSITPHTGYCSTHIGVSYPKIGVSHSHAGKQWQY